jgi:ABC-2 type transport system ATP-binding protein
VHLNQEKGVTIILTTHYTEEADYLCKRILIIDFGKVVVMDTPDNLKARLEGDVVTLLFKDPAAIETLRSLLENKEWIRRINIVASGNNYAAITRMMQDQQNPKHPVAENGTQFEGETCSKCLNLLVDNGGHRIPEIVKLSDETGVVLESVELRKPTLDDVFLTVTGRNIREEEGSIVDMVRRHRIMQQARGHRGRG